MPDESLRLPSSLFRAVLNLGDKRAVSKSLPAGFSKPYLDAEWDPEEQLTAIYIHFDEGDMHLECASSGITFHFHDAEGETVAESPWSLRDTAALVEWATLLTMDVHALMPGLEDDAEEAAAWHEEGYTIYVCESDPAQLDLIEVELEGELMTLPWLGAGNVSHDHIDGENHPIALLWNPDDREPDRPIARAWLDPETEEARAVPMPGIDWTAVGLTDAEVASWLEGIYLNHHVLADPASEILRAALERIAGVDGGQPPVDR